MFYAGLTFELSFFQVPIVLGTRVGVGDTCPEVQSGPP